MNADKSDSAIESERCPLGEATRVKLMDAALKFSHDSEDFMRTYFELYKTARRIQFGFVDEITLSHQATAGVHDGCSVEA